MRTIFLSLLIVVTACQPAQPKSAVSKYTERDQDDDFFGALFVHMGLAASTIAASTAGNKKEAYVAFVIGSLALYQSADIASVATDGVGLQGVSYHVYLSGEDSFLKIKHREVVRYLRKHQELYRNLGAHRMVEDNGDVNDQFIEGLLITWGYHDLGPKDKLAIVKQILDVMQMDRLERTPTEEVLEQRGIADPHVLELNRIMNGVKRTKLDFDERTQRLRQTHYAIIAESIGVSALLGRATVQKRFPIQIAIALLGGATFFGSQWIKDRGWEVSPLLEDFLNSGAKVDELELAVNYAAYKIHFSNRTVEDLYDDRGRVKDLYAQGFLSVWNRNGEKWSVEREKRVLRQLLITLRADESDSSEDLIRRGVKDTEFLVMFEAWKKARKSSDTE